MKFDPKKISDLVKKSKTSNAIPAGGLNQYVTSDRPTTLRSIALEDLSVNCSVVFRRALSPMSRRYFLVARFTTR